MQKNIAVSQYAGMVKTTLELPPTDDTAIQRIPISRINHFEKNPRTISKDQFEKLKQSIIGDPHFFDLRPCLLNETPEGDLLCYAGNQRLRAAKALGWKTVPCIVDHDLLPEVMRARCIKDNVHHGEFDFDLLANEYEPTQLLEWGMLEEDLHLSSLDDSSALDGDADPESSKCPECGRKLKNGKKTLG